MSLLKALVLTTILLFAAAHNAAANSIGVVSEQTGPTEIQRKQQVLPSSLKTAIEANDAIITAQARVGIVFRDSSTVQITEQSRLVIDSFVFDDSKQDAGKLALKVALGTARFASGQIAKHSPESIKVDTPTATIGVRGTDFTLTVDEIGRSLIILLPSCPVGWKNIERDCVVGEISVTTGMGTVSLNRAFQATTAKSRESDPAKPVIIRLNADQINNLLILTPPREILQQERASTARANILDRNDLNTDLLSFSELSLNHLDKDQLSVNSLDQDLLSNLLDDFINLLNSNRNNRERALLPNYSPSNRNAGLRYNIVDRNITLFRETPSNYIEVTVDRDNATTLNLVQDSINIEQNVNRSGGSSITIRQSR